MSLTPKDPAEIIVVSFDFAALAAVVQSPVVTAEVVSGVADATPGALLSGAAQVDGAQVLQQVVGGVAGATYLIRCQVDTASGQRYVLAATLPVFRATPS